MKVFASKSFKKVSLYTLGAVVLICVLMTSVSYAAGRGPLGWIFKPIKAIQTNDAQNDFSATSTSQAENGTDEEIPVQRTEKGVMPVPKKSFMGIEAGAVSEPVPIAEVKTAAEVLAPDPNIQREKDVRVELAQLNQIDFQIDNYSDEALVTLLNNSRTLEGEQLFYKVRAVTQKWSLLDVKNTSADWLHLIVADYRTKLKVELAGY